MELLLNNLNTTDAIIGFLCLVIAAQQVGIFNLINEVKQLSKQSGESASPRMQLMLSMMTPTPEMLQRGAIWFDEYVKSDSDQSNDKYGNLARRLTRAGQSEPKQSVENSGVPPLTTNIDAGAVASAEIEAANDA